MNKNISNLDRTLRIVIGLVLLSLTLVGPKTAWGYLGLILIITASISFCPIYRVLGLSTCKKP